MKYLLLIILLGAANTWAQSKSIIGTWKFTQYRYEGHVLPAPNPDLDLRFTFDKKGHSLLKWLRKNEPGFCERIANYQVESKTFVRQKTVWVNPQNDISCAGDLEMKIGNETVTPFQIKDNNLELELGLGGNPFTYILTPVH